MDLDDILLLRELLDQPIDQRTDLLAGRCGGDPERHRRLATALAQADSALAAEPPAPVALQAGRQVGPFRLLRPLGSGGMGQVWLAERCDDYVQRVAIKWLTACTSASARTRFARERTLLARLDHPGIARIVDGGESDGVPWYAMEYVDGLPLDRFVATHALPLAARLEQVRVLCAAVAYAHAHLIIHRDLKPANILVTADGQPRLLDFGIAKLLDDDAQTETRAPMTLAYAAPEQFSGAPVSAATDVYALGVILYELCCGERPHAVGSAAALVQAVTTTDPLPPSRRRTEASGAAAADIDSDLDTLILTALARAPDRRYPSVNELSADLERYLAGYPIRARPAPWSHHARLWLRRNRLAATLGVLAVGSLLLGSAVALWQAAAARRHAAAAELAAGTAQATTDALVRLLAQARPDEDGGAVPTIREALALGSRDLLADLADQPQVRRAVLGELTSIQNELGDGQASIDLLATEVGRPAAPTATDLRLAANYAAALRTSGRLDDARPWLDWLRDAVSARPADDAFALEVLEERLRLDADAGNRPGAIASATALVAAVRAAPAASALAVSTALELHGSLLLEESRFRDALAPLEEARRLLGDDRGSRLRRARLDGLLANAYRETDQNDRADALIAESLDWHRRVLGPDHPSTLTVRMAVANHARIARRFDEAYDEISAVLAQRQRLFGPAHPAVAHCHNEMALVDYDRARYAEAAAGFARAQEIWSARLGPSHDHTLTAQSNRAGALAEIGDAAAARRELDQVIAIRRAQGSALLKGLLTTRGLALEQLGDETAALQDFDESQALSRSAAGAQMVDWVWASLLGARAQRRLGRAADARPTLEAAMEYYLQSPVGCGPRCAIAHLELSRALIDLGRPRSEALPLAEKAVSVRSDKLGAEHPLTVEARQWRDRLRGG